MSAAATASSNAPADRRSRRTRLAIVQAFNRLILEHGYAALAPAMVAAAADVGRSTFYEHFRGLDDLLAQSLHPVLAPLAGSCCEPADGDALPEILAHIWENRRLARALFSGDAYPIVLRCLKAHIELVLEARGGELVVTDELVAAQLAAGQLALLTEWLTGRTGHDASAIAGVLERSGRAVVMALGRAELGSSIDARIRR